MLQIISLILLGLVGGYFLSRFRMYILKQGIETVKNNEFDVSKLKKGLLSVSDKVLWAKDISQEFNIRKGIIFIFKIIFILSIVYGVAYYRGRIDAPVKFDLRGKEATIQLNEHFLKIEKDGTAKVVTKDGEVVKTIRVKDIPELRKALRPWGFQLEPMVVAGGGIGASGNGIEAGAGISWFKFYRWNLDSFLTNRGIYPIGTSYKITDNSGIGLGAGIGYEGDRRVILYYKWRF